MQKTQKIEKERKREKVPIKHIRRVSRNLSLHNTDNRKCIKVDISS